MSYSDTGPVAYQAPNQEKRRKKKKCYSEIPCRSAGKKMIWSSTNTAPLLQKIIWEWRMKVIYIWK